VKVKFLIIRFSAIGDIVLTSPVVRCLKKQVAGAEVHFVTKAKYAYLVKANPYIDKIHVLKESFTVLNAELLEEKFDYIIDLNQNIRSNRINRALKIRSFSFNKLNLLKFLLIRLKIDRLPDKHIVDRYMETLTPFEVTNDGQGLDYFIPDGEAFDVSTLPEMFQNGYLVFVIAGTYTTKKLTPEKVIQVCNAISFPVVLIGGEEEREAGDKILFECKGNVLNLAGKITLNQSASLVRNAKLVLTNDTGLMHIAAAYKKKILSFWGNTVPRFGMYPYLPHPASAIMEVKNLKCRPCSKLGYRKCPKNHFRCMRDQDVIQMVDWVNSNY